MTDEIKENRLSTLQIVKNNQEMDEISRLKKSLAQIAALMDVKYNFTKGQIIKLKPGLKMANFPPYGEPVIIREVLEIPLQNTNEKTASPYFCEKLDIIIGILDTDGEFVEFPADGRRYEPFDKQE